MEEMEITATPADKETGYCLMRKSTLATIHKEMLQSSMYTEISPLDINLDEIMSTYNRLCKKIAALEQDPRLLRELQKSAYEGKSIISTLSIKTKTHKPQGEVSHRNVHSSPSPKFAGVSTWIRLQLQEIMHLHPHFITSTEQLVEQLVEHSDLHAKEKQKQG